MITWRSTVLCTTRIAWHRLFIKSKFIKTVCRLAEHSKSKVLLHLVQYNICVAQFIGINSQIIKEKVWMVTDTTVVWKMRKPHFLTLCTTTLDLDLWFITKVIKQLAGASSSPQLRRWHWSNQPVSGWLNSEILPTLNNIPDRYYIQHKYSVNYTILTE